MSKAIKPSEGSWAAGLGNAALAAVLGLILLETPFGRGLKDFGFDLMTVARGNLPANEAVIVYMDDASYLQLGQPLNAPWDRALHARLIERLAQAGARAIVFDIVFSDPNPTQPEADDRLAEAMARYGMVVLGADHVPDGPAAKRFVPPFDLLLDQAGAVGSVELDPSRDLIVRRHSPLEDLIPSLSWATAELLETEATKDPGARKAKRWINYYGPPNHLPWVSYHEALDPSRLGDDFFAGRVVFVGDKRMTKFAGERKDEYRNPYSYWLTESMKKEQGTPFISGVEIQATAFLNYWRGDWLRRWDQGTERWWVVLLGAAAGFWFIRLRPLAAMGAAAVAALLVALVFYHIHVRQLVWFPWLIVISQLAVAVAVALSYNSVQLYIQKRLFEHTLGLYLSPKLVRRFSHDTNLLKPGGEEHLLTIMFTDIASFTDQTQQMDSDTLGRLMNDYFHVAVTECIHPHDGTVVKYIGDAIFAFWNAPETQEDHALRCTRAALLLGEKRFAWPQGGALVTRIGVHTGRARVGNFGSPERVDYTALGESVNMASRLEGLNKYLGTRCLISRATHDLLDGQLLTRRMGNFQLKGFDKPIEVYELLGDSEPEESTRPWREEFGAALANYERGEMELAAMGFRGTLERRPGDGPSQYYLDHLNEMDGQALPLDWDGRTRLFDK